MFDMSEIVPDRIRPLRRAEYDQLIEAGAFEDEKIELLAGMLVTMSPIGEPHNALVEVLNLFFARALPPGYAVRPQCSFGLSDDSEPEPDFTIVRASIPGAKDLPTHALLVIEVAQSSLRKDRGLKARLYAEAGVADYWIVNVADESIEVHRNPVGGRYQSVEAVERSATVRPLAFPDLAVCLDTMIANHGR